MNSAMEAYQDECYSAMQTQQDAFCQSTHISSSSVYKTFVHCTGELKSWIKIGLDGAGVIIYYRIK